MNLFDYVLDPKLLRNLPRYVLQCSLATLVLLGVVLARDALASAVVVAAIGSTAFVLFIMPHSEMAEPRHVLGGHGIALATGRPPPRSSIRASHGSSLSAARSRLA